LAFVKEKEMKASFGILGLQMVLQLLQHNCVSGWDCDYLKYLT